MQARVELEPLGFVVMIGEEAWTTDPQFKFTLTSRSYARELAAALNEGDTDAANRIASAHGRLWNLGEGQ